MKLKFVVYLHLYTVQNIGYHKNNNYNLWFVYIYIQYKTLKLKQNRTVIHIAVAAPFFSITTGMTVPFT